jgi:hypothetical protein
MLTATVLNLRSIGGLDGFADHGDGLHGEAPKNSVPAPIHKKSDESGFGRGTMEQTLTGAWREASVIQPICSTGGVRRRDIPCREFPESDDRGSTAQSSCSCHYLIYSLPTTEELGHFATLQERSFV